MSTPAFQRIYFTALATLMRRELTRIFRIWTQTLLPSPMTIVLYLVVFGSMIGPRIGTVNGVRYIDYIVPGLIMMGVINNAFSNTASSLFSAKLVKNIEEMIVAPIPAIYLVLGFCSGGILRGLLVALIVMGICELFTDLYIHSMLIMVITAFLTACLFSVGGFINGLYAKKFDDVSLIPTFLLTPMTYLGGVFYSIEMLPEQWRFISYYNPVFYIINAFRYGMLGQSDIALSTSLPALTALTVCLTTLAWWLTRQGCGIKQ